MDANVIAKEMYYTYWYQSFLNETKNNKDLKYIYCGIISKNNPDIGWYYYWISSNKNITWEIVKDNPDKPWNYHRLSCNPNITFDIIKKNSDKDWNYISLCCNTHTIFKKKFTEKLSNTIKYFRNFVKEELLSIVWHPDNINYWKYLDSEKIGF